MICPRCRCEVGNQSVCPYCGGTVYVSSSGWNTTDYARRTAPVPQNTRTKSPERRNLERKLHDVETKVNMLLVLHGGVLALSVLTLLLIALK